jgi:CAAX protease family protein
VAGLVAAANLVAFLVIRFLLRHTPHASMASTLSPSVAALSDGLLFLFTAVAALIMSQIEHRGWGEYGLPARFAFRRNFWLGTVLGFLTISATLGAISVLHGFQLAGMAIHGETIILATLARAGAFVLVGLGEEFAFRGYLQYTLTTGLGL